MNKLFFVVFIFGSFAYASESPSLSPRSMQINSSPKIDIDQMLKLVKTSKSNPVISRVRRQSQDFNGNFEKEENITAATLNRNRSGTK